MFEFATYACMQNKPTLLYRQQEQSHHCLMLASETGKTPGPLKGHM